MRIAVGQRNLGNWCTRSHRTSPLPRGATRSYCRPQLCIVWVLWWRPNHPYLCTAWRRKGVFGSLGCPSLSCTMPKNIVWVLGWRPKHPYVCTPWFRKGVFGSLECPSLKCTMPESIVWVLGKPQTRIPLHTMDQKRCVLDT